MKNILIIASLFLLSAFNADFQGAASKIMDDSKEFASIVITKDGEIFQIRTKQTSVDTQFYIGSVTKHFTAYMLLTTLAQRFPDQNLELLLNKKLNKLFPESNLLKKLECDWITQVTLLDLLTHRSGLSDYIQYYNNAPFSPEKLNSPISATDLIKLSQHNPKKDHTYSNTNYLLIGKLIEELYGKSFDQAFNEIVKMPADLQNTYAPVTQNYFELKTMPCCLNLAPNLNEKVFIDMANALGTGNIISTAEDMTKWGQHLFKNASKKIVDVMLKNYGEEPDGDISNLGLGTQQTEKLGKLIGHTGSQDSFNSFFGYAPESDTLIIFLSNNEYDNDRAMEALENWIS